MSFEKAFTFAAVNASDSPQTRLGVFPIVAPEDFADARANKNLLAVGTKQDNEERFERFMQTKDARDVISGRFWLGVPESVALFANPEPAKVKLITEGRDRGRIVPVTPQGEDTLKGLDALVSGDAIKVDRAKWNMQPFDWTKQALTGSNVLQRIQVTAAWTDPHMAVALEVIHHDCERIRTIGSFRFVFLPRP